GADEGRNYTRSNPGEKGYGGDGPVREPRRRAAAPAGAWSVAAAIIRRLRLLRRDDVVRPVFGESRCRGNRARCHVESDRRGAEGQGARAEQHGCDYLGHESLPLYWRWTESCRPSTAPPPRFTEEQAACQLTLPPVQPRETRRIQRCCFAVEGVGVGQIPSTGGQHAPVEFICGNSSK